MSDLVIGQCIASALDVSYQRYCEWCQGLNCRPANYDAWLRMEKLGPTLRAAQGVVKGMTILPSFAEHQRRQAAMQEA